MADIVPDPQHSLMVIRLSGNMSMDEQAKAAGDVSKLIRSYNFDGMKVLPSGPAILIEEINNNMRTNLIKTAALATVLMIVVLALVFRRALAAALAARRARRLRVGIRADGLPERAADHGDDLGPADPHRPRRRLRHPVP
jgi:hypothetical protein